VAGRHIGSVVALPSADFARLRTIVSSVASGLVLVGTILSVVLVFAPARRRIRSLEGVAARVGRGDLSARANEKGGDELAMLARAFNRMTEDLFQRAAEVEAGGQRRRRLLADVSHELLTPLTTMRGYLETLRMPEVSISNEARSRYTAILSDEVERLELLVGDLLDLALLEEGRLRFDFDDVAVEQLLGRQMARFEGEANSRGVRLTATIQPGAAIVVGDPTRLDQALRNLIANALRHTPRTGQVALEARLAGQMVELSVADTGTGIPSEDLPFVFDRFYRGDCSRTAASGGRGLGLSIVRAVVEGHGGRVSVRSDLGKGTTFTIQLPAEIDGSQVHV
jgi:two-component system sensor histidine kinase BaeS